MRIITQSPEETINLGQNLGKQLSPGDILLLYGELGAGKTLLVQGIAKGLDLKPGEHVRSPTFTLINEYEGRCPIYHIDLYRLNSRAEVEGLGLEDYLFGNGVSLIEWPEKLNDTSSQNFLFDIESRLEIRITLGTHEDRIFDLEPIQFQDNSPFLFTLL